MIHKMFWNNGISGSTGVAFVLSRGGDPSVNDYGQAMLANQQRYSAYKAE